MAPISATCMTLLVTCVLIIGQVEADSCDPNPCQNLGTCKKTGWATPITCQCTYDYTGDTCGIERPLLNLTVDNPVTGSKDNDPYIQTVVPDKGYVIRVDATSCADLVIEVSTTHPRFGNPSFSRIYIIGQTKILDIPDEPSGTVIYIELDIELCYFDTNLNWILEIVRDPAADPCDSNPCQNLGTCTKVNANTFTCQCTSGYTGDTCGTELEPCDPNPCQNGGTCVRVSASVYRCVCPPGIKGTHCEVSGMCSLSYFNKLTTFARENVNITVPCRYNLVSMQCGDFKVQVHGQTRNKCETKKCHKANDTSTITAADISVTSSDITWKANLSFGDLKLTPTVSGDGSLVTVTNEPSKASLATSDNVLSLAFSKEEGIKVMCADIISSDGYPTSLCGAGTGEKKAIHNKTKDRSFNGDYMTVAFDILTANNTVQTSECSRETNTLLNVCQNAVWSFEKCNRCSKEDLQRVHLICLFRCLPHRGKCKN